MLKKLFRFSCFSLICLFIACAPKQKAALPPVYEEAEPALEDIMEKAGGDIAVIKAITDIDIRKNNEPYSALKASILVRQPGMVHMRMYQLGILVRDFVIRDDTLFMLSGSRDSRLKELGRELYNAIFWWDNYRMARLYRDDTEYIIVAEDKIIHLDRETLLPLRQDIQSPERKIRITYDNPVDHKGFWYPSLLKIYVNEFTFTVKLKKLFKNPELGEFDFLTPAES